MDVLSRADYRAEIEQLSKDVVESADSAGGEMTQSEVDAIMDEINEAVDEHIWFVNENAALWGKIAAHTTESDSPALLMDWSTRFDKQLDETDTEKDAVRKIAEIAVKTDIADLAYQMSVEK